jgi:hypothetical protein
MSNNMKVPTRNMTAVSVSESRIFLLFQRHPASELLGSGVIEVICDCPSAGIKMAAA